MGDIEVDGGDAKGDDVVIAFAAADIIFEGFFDLGFWEGSFHGDTYGEGAGDLFHGFLRLRSFQDVRFFGFSCANVP